jgi:hypothetical protein
VIAPEVSRRLAYALQHPSLARDPEYVRRAQATAERATSWADLPEDVRLPADTAIATMGGPPPPTSLEGA